MPGTLANVSLILFGGLFFFCRRKELSAENQQLTRVLIAMLVLYSGVHLLWTNLSGSFLHVLGQLGILFVSLNLGRFLGKALHLQQGFNRIARFAKDRFTEPDKRPPHEQTGFLLASGLFCMTPLAFIGALVEGSSADPLPLIIKGMMDAIATLSFVRLFGFSVLLAVVPVLALQGTLSLITHSLLVQTARPDLVAALCSCAGCLVFSVISLVFGVQQIRLGDYLPSLIIAPLLALWWW